MSAPPRSFRTIPRFDPRRIPVESRDSGSPAVPWEQLQLPALRGRLLRPPQWTPELTGDRGWVHETALKEAAVLVPIVDRARGPMVILTERTAHLSKHAGEVAF
ncbi:MAG: hypothetical protein RIS35_768, partial [Pseudomonadota bacterium]